MLCIRCSWECNTAGPECGPANTLNQAADADPKFGMKVNIGGATTPRFVVGAPVKTLVPHAKHRPTNPFHPSTLTQGLVPERLAMSEDPAARLYYSNWTPSMHKWAAEDFDTGFRTREAVPGSPDPALRIVES